MQGRVLFTIVGLLFLVSCANEIKINSMDDLEKQSEYLNNNIDTFNDAAEMFIKYPSLRSIELNSIDENDKNMNGLYINQSGDCEEEDYEEIYNNVYAVFEQCKIEKILKRGENYIDFVYASTLGKGVGWMYSIDGSEPDKDKYYIIRMEKATDNWYSGSFY